MSASLHEPLQNLCWKAARALLLVARFRASHVERSFSLYVSSYAQTFPQLNTTLTKTLKGRKLALFYQAHMDSGCMLYEHLQTLRLCYQAYPSFSVVQVINPCHHVKRMKLNNHQIFKKERI